jgi:hypothetical protein
MSVRQVFPNIRDAWEGIYFGFLEDRPGVIDYYQRNIIHSHNNQIIAKSAVMDYDLGEIGMTPTKWTKFTGQYVDVESLHVWVNNAMNVKTYDALWTFKIVPPNFSGEKAVHQWGNCLLGYSFRRQGGPPTLTLYTRAQSIGFSGVADYALSSYVASKLAERMGIPQEKIRLQIYCPNLILKTVETVHFLHQRGLLDEYLVKEGRIGNAVRYYYDYMNRPEEDIRWRAARRMKHKLEASQAERYRSMPVKDLILRGWDGEKRQNRKLSARDSAKLVLSGIGRRGSVVATPAEAQVIEEVELAV